MIAIDLSEQQAVDANPKAIQHFKFTGNLNRGGIPTMYFIIEEAQETISDFSQGTVRDLQLFFLI